MWSCIVTCAVTCMHGSLEKNNIYKQFAKVVNLSINE